MIRRWLFVAAVWLLAGDLPAQSFTIQEQRINRQRITTITPVFPGLTPGALPSGLTPGAHPGCPSGRCNVPGAKQPGPFIPVPPPGTVPQLPAPKEKEKEKEKGKEEVAVPPHEEILQGRWASAVSFTDGKGRTWNLVQGAPLADQPEQLPGWILSAGEGQELFYSRTGRLFRLVRTP